MQSQNIRYRDIIVRSNCFSRLGYNLLIHCLTTWNYFDKRLSTLKFPINGSQRNANIIRTFKAETRF